MPAVGIDIEEDAIRFVELMKKEGDIRLKQYGTRPLPPGTIKNGDILNADELKRQLRAFRDEYKFDFANISLPEEKAYIFRTAVPLADPAQVHDSIEFQLEENVPLSLSEALFDYSIVNNVHKDPNHLDVVVVVLPRQYVTNYSALIQESGIFPLSLQIAPTAIARSLLKERDQKTYMVVNFYQEKTGIIIMSHGVAQFTSTVGIGSNAFTSSIEKHFGVSTEEARRIKRGESFVPNKERLDMFYSLINTVSALKDEMQRLFTYWHTFKGRSEDTNDKIERVILCGDDALLPGLDEYLSIMLETPVDVGNVWTNAFSFDQYVPAMKFNDSLNYAVSIGLAIVDSN
jgi:type IV pilus assembly protein PilM